MGHLALHRRSGPSGGINITLNDIGPVLIGWRRRAGHPLPPEEKRYRVGAGGVTRRQFLMQDPDGYLIRFAQGAEFTRRGLEAYATSPADLATSIQAETQRWAPLVRASGVTPEG